MKKLNALLGLLVASRVLTACVVAQAMMVTNAVPDDGKDDRSVIQQEIDELERSGGGKLQLGRGVYDLSGPIYIRSNVELAGAGEDTVITNEALNDSPTWLGATVFAGNLAPGSYDDNDGRGYGGTKVTRVGKRTISLLKCDADAAELKDRIIWFTAGYRKIGRRANVRPEYGEMNKVLDVVDCQLSMADDINIPVDEPLYLHWSDGSKTFPTELEPNRPVENAAITNLQLRSARSQALISTGCYNCRFTNLWVGRSRRLLMAQGMRHTIYKGVYGQFWERGIEIAMFNQDVTIEDVTAKFVDDEMGKNYKVRPAIRFGEYARGTVLRNVTLDLGDHYSNKFKVRFDESSDNLLQNVTLITESRDDGRTFFVKGGVPGGRASKFPENTRFDNFRLCHGTDMLDCQMTIPIAPDGLPLSN